MKRLALISFLACASAFGAATDIVVPQRDANNRNQYITIRGSTNTWEALGFNGSGILSSLSLFDLTPSTGRTAGQILAVDDAATGLEWITPTVAIEDGDKGDITVSGSGATWAIDSGVIVNADINASAAIALSKLATDPLARANHTGTQTLSTISDAGTLAGLSEVASAQITDGAIVNADISGSAAIAASKVADVGITKSGTQASPTTTNPLAPTWTTQDYIVYYGATGEIDLPAVASYANKTAYIYVTGTFTVTVDPNGSEIIVENGVSLGAGVADSISGTAGTFVGYTCDGSRWIKLEGGGAGVASLTPWTENIDGATYNLTTSGAITAGTVAATSYTGSASAMTDIPGSEIIGPLPDLTYGQITTSEAMIFTPTAGTSNVVVTTDALTTITLDATTETLTYSGTPVTGAIFHYLLTAHTSDCTVTIPSTYSFATGGNRTEYVVRANKNAYISVFRSASAYYMWGDPVEIGTLPEDTTPATSAKVEIDQGSGGEFATLANIKTALNLGSSKSGTFGTPTTTNPLAPTWDGEFYVVWYGATGEIDLPAAASYTNRGITIYNTGSFTITVDPNASEVIVRDGTAQTGGVTFTLSSGAGNFVNLISDGEKWITLGYKGSLTVGS